MKYIKSFFVLVILACGLPLNAQIGYQVSLLNSATGEPRANETVSVQVEITNSANTVICSETKSATTNEFGVLSLQVGNDTTFRNVDWNKRPLYVSASVDGIMIGKSQILNVPVAEAAKTLMNVAPELICKTWRRETTCYCSYPCPTSKDPDRECTTTGQGIFSFTLNEDYTYNINFTCGCNGNSTNANGTYRVQGNLIFLFRDWPAQGGENIVLPVCYIYDNGTLYGIDSYGYGVGIVFN